MSAGRATGVLFLAESYHPVLGGGEQHLRTLARRLGESGMRATVITRQTETAWPRDETLEGVRVLRVPPARYGRSGKYRMVPAAVAALLREGKTHDVVVVRGTRVLGLPGLFVARVLARPIVLQPEINGELSGEAYTWGTALDRPLPRALVRAAAAARSLLLRDADAVVAMSRRIALECRAAGVAEERVRHIPHGVDTEQFVPVEDGQRDALRRQLGLPGGARIIVYTGRLLRGKGLEDLLAAFTRLVARTPPAHLLLVGSGAGQSLSIEEALRGKVEAEGLRGHVTFTGRVDDVVPWLQASDVFAFPSVFEALGLSLIEAAACGLPAVAARTGGIVDVVEEGRSGLLVEAGNVAALAEALSGLLDDEDRRRAYGTRARVVAVARFDLHDSVDRYRALFQELAGLSRGAFVNPPPRSSSRGA